MMKMNRLDAERRDGKRVQKTGCSRRAQAGLLLAALSVLTPPVCAKRPYLLTDTAMVRDEEAAFSVNTWLSAARRQTSFDTELEYALNPFNAVAISADLNRSKEAGVKTYTRAYGMAYQHNFVDSSREGYGVGFRLSGTVDRENGSLHRQGSLVSVPLSWRNDSGTTVIHLNPGYAMPHAAPDHVVWALSGQESLSQRDSVFVEVAGDRSDHERRLLHGGWRHWLKRNKVALDVTVGRWGGQRDDGFFTVGLALFDLR